METIVSNNYTLKAKGLVRGVLWKLEVFEADRFAEHVGVERPSSRARASKSLFA